MSQRLSQPHSPLHGLVAALLAAGMLAACGGGGGSESAGAGSSGPAVAAGCDDASRKLALRDYFNDWYFWYRSSPQPVAQSDASLGDYFKSLLYTGVNGDSAFPADRWSYVDTTVNFQRFFSDGQTLGYGIFVNGVETTGHPEMPLLVRYTEPLGPAAAAGIVRGDRLLSINGKAAAELLAANDFSALTPSKPGEVLILKVSGSAGERQVTLTAVAYDLTPVTGSQVVTSAKGRQVGYVMVKDMISQVGLPMSVAYTKLRLAGITELVLDLRYNGGGLVSVGRDIASLLAGQRGAGQTYAALQYNDKQSAIYNTRYAFNPPPLSLSLQRVYILTGERTCSASEQVANGLRGVMDVVLVGRTSCGKPVGFLPHDDGCGSTYSVVNFESVNARNEGRYFNGLRPTCAASEDWSQALGSLREPLLAAALSHADGGACVAPSVSERPQALSLKLHRALADEGERSTMLVR